MQWQEGSFVIEPSFFSHDEPITALTGHEPEDKPADIPAEPSEDKSGPKTPEEKEEDKESLENPEELVESGDIEKAEIPDEPEKTTLTTREIVEGLLNDTLKELVSIVGSQHLRESIIASQEQLVPYFVTLESLKISFTPEFKAELSLDGKWTDKRTLAIAVFLQSILQRCTTLAIGMRYFDIREIAGPNAPELDRISFFDYMSHANELAGTR